MRCNGSIKIHVIGRNTLNISKEYTNLKEQGELKFAFNRCFEDWKRVLAKRNLLGIVVCPISNRKKQLSFYFLYLISKNYLQRLDAIKTDKKYIVYQNVELDYLFTSQVCHLRPCSNDYCAK
jgi:hypothetical protein